MKTALAVLLALALPAEVARGDTPEAAPRPAAPGGRDPGGLR